ncbi:MAG: response regulator [Thermodesulfobacteriota bacterium]
MIKVLIADDHPVVRMGLKLILKNEPDISVEYEAKTAKETITFIRKEKFNIVLLDISMPDRSGLDVLAQLKRQYPELPVLILSMHSEDQYATRVLKAGAAGYMTKDSAPEELVKAVRKVTSGGRYVSPSLAEKLAYDLTNQFDKSMHENLSDRELQVMCMIADGKTITEISNELYLSVKTVSTYRSRILKKMNMKNNADLIRYSIENKFVSTLPDSQVM